MSAAGIPCQPDGERRVCPPVVAGAGGGDRAGGGDAPVLPRSVPELLNRPVSVVQDVVTGETVERSLCREAAPALLAVPSNIVGWKLPATSYWSRPKLFCLIFTFSQYKRIPSSSIFLVGNSVGRPWGTQEICLHHAPLPAINVSWLSLQQVGPGGEKKVSPYVDHRQVPARALNPHNSTQKLSEREKCLAKECKERVGAAPVWVADCVLQAALSTRQQCAEDAPQPRPRCLHSVHSGSSGSLSILIYSCQMQAKSNFTRRAHSI